MPTAHALSKHARELHEQSIVITSHDHVLEYEDLSRMRQGGLDAKVCLVQVDVLAWDDEGKDSVLGSLYSDEGWARRALTKIERILQTIDAHPDQFLLVRSVTDILEAHRTGRAGIILGFEGARPLEASIDLLRMYYRLGLRHLQLTWAYGNQVCDLSSPPGGEITWSNYRGTKTPGLTDFGRQVVSEANRLGIVLDPSHTTKQTYYELLESTAHPIVIGHATCRDAGKNAGDIADEELRALAQNGGVICLHFFAHYLRDHNAGIDDLIDHILHVAQVVGIEYVGLGPDWLPLTSEYLRIHDRFAGLPEGYVRPDDQPLGPIAELDNPAKLPRLTERLVERGFGDDDICKVLGGNLLRVYREIWGD